MIHILLFVLLVASIPCKAHSPVTIGVLLPKEQENNLNRAQQLRCVADIFKKRWEPKNTLRLQSFFYEQDAASSLIAAQDAVRAQVDAVAGAHYSSEALTAEEVLEKAKIPFFVAAASHPKITEGKKYVYQISANDIRQARQLVNLARRKPIAKRILVFTNESEPYSTYLSDAFIRAFQSDKKTRVESFHVINGFSDWDEVEKKIRSFQPELVFAPVYHQHLAPLYGVLRKSKLKLRLLASDTFGGDAKFLEMLGELSPSIAIQHTAQWDKDLRGRRANAFKKEVADHCPGLEPSLHMVGLYDALLFLEAGGYRNPQVSVKGLLGTIHFPKGIHTVEKDFRVFELLPNGMRKTVH